MAQKLQYKVIDDKKSIKIFGKEFVENNKYNFELLLNEEKLELSEFLDINEIKGKKTVEIQLRNVNSVINMSKMFEDCKQLASIRNIKNFDTKNVTDMSYMFKGCSSLRFLPDISVFDISNVKNISSMFQDCSLLPSLSDISSWNTSNIINMQKLFYGCSSLLSLPDISKWNTINVKNMTGIFQNCSSLKNLPDISKWDTNNVNSMAYMFYGCSSLLSLPDISKWNTSNVNDISFMFFNCSKLKSFPCISEWKVNNLKKTSFLFSGCSSFVNLPDISKWNDTIKKNNLIEKKENTENMDNKNNYFLSCKNCQEIPEIILKDNKRILLKCIKCGKIENEKIENICNYISKWIQKSIILCSNHKEKNPSDNYCKKCNLFLCKNCLLIHDKSHDIQEIKKIDFKSICNHQNQNILYNCYDCNLKICNNCLNIHKFHEFQKLDDNEKDLINDLSKVLTNIKIKAENTKKIKNKKNKILLELLENKKDENLNNNEFIIIKSNINKKIKNDLIFDNNLLILSEIIFNTFRKIKINLLDKKYIKYKTIFKIIIDYLSDEQIRKYNQEFYLPNKKYLSSNKSIYKEIEKLKENITVILNKNENNIPNFDKKKHFIENCFDYSNIIKNYTTIEKIVHKKNYIKINEELSKVKNITKNINSKENSNFVLSLLGKCFEKKGTKIYISKNKEENLKNVELFSIQSLFSLNDHKKYEFHFDFGEETNKKILNNPIEGQKFLESWKIKISKKLNINPENLIFRDIHQGCVAVHASIINPEKDQEIKIKELESIDGITKIEEKPIFEYLQISSSILDSKGDKYRNFSQNSFRGGEKYIPPNDDWYGIGLKVENMYDNCNNTWLSSKNIDGEFAVAYLGINSYISNSEEMIKELNSLSQDIKNKISQKLYKNEKDIRNNNIECGDGIIVFQNPKYAENNAGILDILGYRIKIILMCRVNPKKIRQPESFEDCWILNPTPDEIRPYRILIKKIPFSPLVGTLNDEIIISKMPVNYIVSVIKSNDLSFLNLRNNTFFEFCSILNNQLVSDDFFVIRLYSSIYYLYINNYLRTKEVIILDDLENLSESEIKSWICCLQLALSRNINVKDETLVYRGVNLKFPSEIGIGSKFYFREFVSTSTSQEFSEQWIDNSGTLMIIKIKNNGTNGHQNYCYYIEDITISEDQYEVLISSHCYFTVTKIEHKKNIDYIYLTCEGCLLESIPQAFYDEININYKIDESKKIQIFGEPFVENNKNNCKIVYNGNEYNLNAFFDIDNISMDEEKILKIKLKGIRNITDMSHMFDNCSKLISIPDIHKWNTEKVTDMSYLFGGCTIPFLPDISNWDTRNVTHMNNIFSYCRSLISIPDISKWNTSNLTNLNSIFYYCEKICTLPDISKWDTSKVTDFETIFFACHSLTSLPDISKWNTSKVINMTCLFQGCRSLISLPDISKWDTSNVNDMTAIFFDCCSLKYLPDISKWNTKNVISMYNMFEGCRNLLSLPDISKWNTDKVTRFGGMFNSCELLSSLPDISKWNTSNVTDMMTMFNNCKSLTNLPDISKWNIEKLDDKNMMFSGCNESLNIPDKFKY